MQREGGLGLKGLKLRGFRWNHEKELAELNKWIAEHDVKQVSSADYFAGYRGVILYKPDEKPDEKLSEEH